MTQGRGSALVRVGVVDRSVVREVQWRVLRDGVPLPERFEPDPPGTFSVGAVSASGDVIGAATFFPESSPLVDLPAQWRLRGMATLAEARGQGVGSAVLAAGFAEIARRGGRSVWCNARSSALGFYRREGFETIGEEFVVAEIGLPHYVAARLIPDELVTEQAPTAPA